MPPRRLHSAPAIVVLRVPGAATLARYGLSVESWNQLADLQGRVCYVCRKLPSSGLLNIDHEHVAGWAKMPDHARALYVRGLLCYWCNSHFVGRGITIAKASRVLDYLKKPLPFSIARQLLPPVAPQLPPAAPGEIHVEAEEADRPDPYRAPPF